MPRKNNLWILNLADVECQNRRTFLCHFPCWQGKKSLTSTPELIISAAVILISNQYFMTYKWLVTQETTFYPSTQLTTEVFLHSLVLQISDYTNSESISELSVPFTPSEPIIHSFCTLLYICKLNSCILGLVILYCNSQNASSVTKV